jgi:hypothetical protein
VGRHLGGRDREGGQELTQSPGDSVNMGGMKLLLFAALAAAQEEKPNPAAGGVNEVAVARAIDRGVAFLRTAASPDLKGAYTNSDELILWTLMHAGVPETDPKFKQLFQSVTTQPLKRTYKVALLAMILEELDRVKYQEKIAQCAQFLVDNQCRNGQWSYGNEVQSVKDVKVTEPERKDVASAGAKGGRPKPTKKVAVARTQDGPETGDNSNSLYAALGLRAAHDAGVTVPASVLTAAIKWWRDSQFAEADRNKGKDGKPMVASGKRGPEGWNYKDKATDEKAPYHGMTAGAVGSLVIYAYIQGKDWKKDPNVQAGMSWMAEKFEIQAWNGYYMYALERMGILYGTELIGTRHWYREGAGAILGTQKADGSWGKDEGDWYGTTWDTCFSILFLRRATRPLVASGVAPLR